MTRNCPASPIWCSRNIARRYSSMDASGTVTDVTCSSGRRPARLSGRRRYPATGNGTPKPVMRCRRRDGGYSLSGSARSREKRGCGLMKLLARPEGGWYPGAGFGRSGGRVSDIARPECPLRNELSDFSRSMRARDDAMQAIRATPNDARLRPQCRRANRPGGGGEPTCARSSTRSCTVCDARTATGVR